MGQIMIKCPNTGQMVPTGFVMDRESFDSATLSDNLVAQCPACGPEHYWDKDDASVADS